MLKLVMTQVQFPDTVTRKRVKEKAYIYGYDRPIE